MTNEKEEYDRLKERYSITVKENTELTLALCTCQEELSFINEKLMLSETASETMKTKLAELLAEAEAISSRYHFFVVQIVSSLQLLGVVVI